MNIQSPEAHDPDLQNKIDELMNAPEEYRLKGELEKIRSHIDNKEMLIRAINNEIEKYYVIMSSIELALLSLEEFRKERFDT